MYEKKNQESYLFSKRKRDDEVFSSKTLRSAKRKNQDSRK